MTGTHKLNMASNGAWQVVLEFQHEGHELTLSGNLLPGLPSSAVEDDLLRMGRQWSDAIDAAKAAQCLVGKAISESDGARISRVDWTATQEPVDFAFALFIEVATADGQARRFRLYRPMPSDDVHEWLNSRFRSGWQPATERYDECPQCGSPRLSLDSIVGHGVDGDLEYCYQRRYGCPDCGWSEVSVCTTDELNNEERQAFAACNRPGRARRVG